MTDTGLRADGQLLTEIDGQIFASTFPISGRAAGCLRAGVSRDNSTTTVTFSDVGEIPRELRHRDGVIELGADKYPRYAVERIGSGAPSVEAYFWRGAALAAFEAAAIDKPAHPKEAAKPREPGYDTSSMGGALAWARLHEALEEIAALPNLVVDGPVHQPTIRSRVSNAELATLSFGKDQVFFSTGRLDLAREVGMGASHAIRREDQDKLSGFIRAFAGKADDVVSRDVRLYVAQRAAAACGHISPVADRARRMELAMFERTLDSYRRLKEPGRHDDEVGATAVRLGRLAVVGRDSFRRSEFAQLAPHTRAAVKFWSDQAEGRCPGRGVAAAPRAQKALALEER